MILQPQWAQVGAMAWIAHSKLSNTWVSPALVISIVLSYSLPQTSHSAMAFLLESGSGIPYPERGPQKMTRARLSSETPRLRCAGRHRREAGSWVAAPGEAAWAAS